tara:strand:+ start:1822 stop:2142 length:321 start_codon:yes stop_codon:yes gene_type:complete
MYQTVNKSQFRNAFHAMGRGDQFTHDALNMLFSYFEDTAPDAELDVIAICCGYSEDMPERIADQYDIDVEDMSDGETLDAVLEYLGEKTQVIGVTDAGAVVYNSEF